MICLCFDIAIQLLICHQNAGSHEFCNAWTISSIGIRQDDLRVQTAIAVDSGRICLDPFQMLSHANLLHGRISDNDFCPGKVIGSDLLWFSEPVFIAINAIHGIDGFLLKQKGY